MTNKIFKINKINKNRLITSNKIRDCRKTWKNNHFLSKNCKSNQSNQKN